MIIPVIVFLCFCTRCDSIEKLKAQLPKMEQELKDQSRFKDFYQFTFNFAKNPGQKGLGRYYFSVFAFRHGPGVI